MKILSQMYLWTFVKSSGHGVVIRILGEDLRHLSALDLQLKRQILTTEIFNRFQNI